MDMTSHVPDNLGDLLAKISQFTACRRSLLHRNLREIRTPGFIPQDMPVGEFAQAMNEAVVEHLLHRRLVFRDTENILFGPNGQMTLSAVTDERAQALLASDPDAYLEHQINKLLENSLNRAVSEELLALNRSLPAEPGHSRTVRSRTEKNRTTDSPTPWDSKG